MNVGESRYELLELIGSGGMAEVYRARMVGAVGFEKLVAIKRLLPHVTSDQEFVQRFVDEARLTARLVHPNICQILDFGVMDECYFITMEYVDGLDLAGVLKGMERDGERIPVDVALYVICGVLRGLKYAHEATDETGSPLGIVHRDVSPHNVLLSVNGDVKLSDLGAATANQAFRSTRTEKHYRLGKVLYMAPEQRRRKSVDARADLYSSGILLAEMLMGVGEFHQEANMFLAGMCSLWDKISDRLASPLGQALSRVVEHALAEDPARRYQSADGMLSELEGLLIEYAPGTSVDRVSRLVQRLKRPQRNTASKEAANDSDELDANAVRSLYTADIEEVNFVDASPPPSSPGEERFTDLQFPDDAPAMLQDPAELDNVMTIAKPEMAIRHPAKDRRPPHLEYNADNEESQLQTTILRKKRPRPNTVEPIQPSQPVLPVGPPGPNAQRVEARPSPPYLEMVVEGLEKPGRLKRAPVEIDDRTPGQETAPPDFRNVQPGLENVATERDAVPVDRFTPTDEPSGTSTSVRRKTLVFIAIAVPIVLFLGVVFGGLIALRLFPDETTAPDAQIGPSSDELISTTPESRIDPPSNPPITTAPAGVVTPPPPPPPSAAKNTDAGPPPPVKTRSKAAPPRVPPSRKRVTPAKPPPQAQKRVSGYGYLNINAHPYGIPYVDGRQVSAETPVARYKVKSGSHVVKVRFPQINKSREQVVHIEPEKTKGVVFSMH